MSFRVFLYDQTQSICVQEETSQLSRKSRLWGSSPGPKKFRVVPKVQDIDMRIKQAETGAPI